MTAKTMAMTDIFILEAFISIFKLDKDIQNLPNSSDFLIVICTTEKMSDSSQIGIYVSVGYICKLCKTSAKHAV